MDPKKLLLSTGGVLLGQWIANTWVLKNQGANGESRGFIEVEAGFGLDDVVEAVVIVLSVSAVHMLGRRFLP